MEDRTIKVAVTTLATITSALLGWVGGLIIIFVVSLTLDMLSGFAVALQHGEWKSSIARAGLWKKAGSIMIVSCGALFEFIIALIVDNVPSLTLPDWWSMYLFPALLIWITLTEIGSILENAGQLGAPLPPFFTSAIKVLKKRVETVSDEDLPES